VTHHVLPQSGTLASTLSRASPAGEEPLLRVDDLQVYFPVKEGTIFPRHVGDVKAVDGISFTIRRGETLGLVGESGCGKSTTGRSILQLIRPTGGTVKLEGVELTELRGQPLRRMRQNMQMIFQDPYSSLSPRMTVDELLREPLEVHHLCNSEGARRDRVAELMSAVGLDPLFVSRYPAEFSGGQRQRIGIARALAVNPKFIVCDEPIAALDVSIQAQIVNLLQNLQSEYGFTYLFIAHDLSMVRHISDQMAVMYLGKIVELSECDQLYDNPLHPYTQALLDAVPVPDPVEEARRPDITLKGEVPSPLNAPKGCNFCTRCPHVMDICREVEPPLLEHAPGHWAACYLYAEGQE
jgi:oligopeptide transport system ATP-binding protein